jgi:hypothetical protein
MKTKNTSVKASKNTSTPAPAPAPKTKAAPTPKITVAIVQRYLELDSAIKQLERERDTIKEQLESAAAVEPITVGQYLIERTEYKQERLGKKDDFVERFGRQVLYDAGLLREITCHRLSVKEGVKEVVFRKAQGQTQVIIK